jgi:hypothetical protein
MGNNDAVDESKLILCCALCCANISFLPSCGALGCSGKVRFFVMSLYSYIFLAKYNVSPYICVVAGWSLLL